MRDPELDTPLIVTPGCVTHRNYEIIDVLTYFGVTMYLA